MRKTVEKPRASGSMSEAQYTSFVKGHLRKASRWWKPISETLKKAKVARGHYTCNICNEVVTNSKVVDGKRVKNIFVDHTEAVTDNHEGFTSWDDFIARLYCEEDNLQLVCSDCHTKKTKEENSVKKIEIPDTKSREYNSWRSMRARCLHRHHEAYSRYGGAGITINPLWVDSFETFYKDMGPRPEGHTLDRIDNLKGYYKENCRWASFEEQANNRKTTVYVELDGDKKTLSQWSKELGIPVSTLNNRLLRGHTVEASLSQNFEKGVRKPAVDWEALLASGKSIEELVSETGYHKDTVRKRVSAYRKKNNDA